MRQFFPFAARAAIVFSLLLQACGQKKEVKPVDPAFTGYVSAFTSGVVSNQSNINIKLAEAYPQAKVNEAVEQDLFEFSPSIAGSAIWVDQRTIQFRPADRLPPGKLVEVRFALSKLLDVPQKLETMVFNFQVMEQGLKILNKGMLAMDQENLRWQSVFGRAITVDKADVDNLKESVKAFQEGRELKINWTHHGEEGKIHHFTVDSVKRKEASGQMIVKYDGAKLGFEEEGEEVFDIPSLSDFKVVSISKAQQPEQSITIYFSDPLNPEQDINGLIHFTNGESITLEREENSVIVHPRNRLIGNHELQITEAIQNVQGYSLQEAVNKHLEFRSLKPEVKLLGSGNILPSSNGLIFPFQAVNLSAVNVKVIKIFDDNINQFLQVNQLDGTRELKRVGRIVHKSEVPLKSDEPIDYGDWNNFSLDLSNLIEAEPGAIYRVELSFNRAHSLYPCEEEATDEAGQDADIFEEDPEESYYDGPDSRRRYYYGNYHYYGTSFNYRERDNPCKPSYYMDRQRQVARNVLASDLGLIVKGSESNRLMVAVTDLVTTEPQSGVEVAFYNYQNQLITKAESGSNGLVSVNLKDKPFLLKASKGQQRGYLRLDDGSSLSLSMFDIGGDEVKHGMKGFIYGERGVWRPGDSLHLNFILQDENEALPENHPITFELYTPQRQLALRKVRTTSVNNFYDFSCVTDRDAPTGNWLAKVNVGGIEFTKTIKIETVKPNRLKINFAFAKEVLQSGTENEGELEVKWLHGAIADNLKADVEMSLTRGSTSFEGYEGFHFDDKGKSFTARDRMIFEGKLDSEGQATVKPNIQVGQEAPGMLTARFKTRVFEKGGDFSVDRFSKPYSPFESYVGLKIPEGKGWNGALYSNESNVLPIVTVDQNGKPVDRKNLKLEIFDVRWRWWWDRSGHDDLAQYVSSRSLHKIKDEEIATSGGKLMYDLKFDKNHWGRKYIRITDPESGHSVGQTFYLTYRGWWSNDGENPGGAEMLSFSTDKDQYQTGETIKVNLPSSKKGRVLVSVEAGSEVLETYWHDLKDGNTLEVEATEAMTPNAYLHLSLVQPHQNVENDLPLRLYGVQSVRVEEPESHLHPVIDMPDELAPEAEFEVKISEKEGRNMTYTLAVVDEGLLDLTRFKTPDPWNHFNVKQALGVRTWDMYKYVMGAFSGKMAGLLAIGGDDYTKKDGGAKANRFKPVVKHLGPFKLEKGQSRTHKIKMPNYVGSVRTMVVAGNERAYGSAEKATPVKKPLMVLATLPRVVGPSEVMTLPVTVFSMDEKVDNVKLEVESNELLEVMDDAQRRVEFTRTGDKVVNFRLRAKKALGIGKVSIKARDGSERASYSVELDVRPSSPRITNVQSKMVKPGESWNTSYTPPGLQGTNRASLEVSMIPPLRLSDRLNYLKRYPHGCIEQTTSSVFPQLFLSSLMELSDEDKVEIEKNIRAGINRLQKFQLVSGGLTFWPGMGRDNEASDWGTSYAGHFMLEAKEQGYTMPPGFINAWTKFQKQRANSWTPDRRGTNFHGTYHPGHLMQAYRLYTLALAQEPALGAMNRLRNVENLANSARWRLAAAYGLMGKKQVAMDLIRNANIKVDDYRSYGYTYGSGLRDMAMILETLAVLNEQTQGTAVLKDVAEYLNRERWYSTQTTAYSLLAVAKFAGEGDLGEKGLEFNYVNQNKTRSVNNSHLIAQLPLDIASTGKQPFTFENTSSRTQFVNLNTSGIPLIGDSTNTSENLGLSVSYYNLDMESINVSRLAQGTDFIAEVTVTHPGIRDNYQDMALTQIFPSGWEIRNLRLDNMDLDISTDNFEYQDIRDDRVYTYFDLPRNGRKQFKLLLNAAYLGEFYLPTVRCEAMYDNDIRARRAGQWVRVMEPGGSAGNPAP